MEIHRVFGTEGAHRVADVVFVHGLNGDHWESWLHRHPESDHINYWPESLGREIGNCGVWSLSYEASPSNWFGSAMPLIDRATSVLNLLDAEDIGERPLFFIAHSFGGLIVKQLLRASLDSKAKIHANTKGIVFFSTPHTGSQLANLVTSFRLPRASAIVEDLRQNGAYLRDLAIWFRSNAKGLGYEVLSYVETVKTNGVMVVDQTSGDPQLDFARPVPFDGNHHDICKIPHEGDHRFKQVSKLIRRCTQARDLHQVANTSLECVSFDIKCVEDPPKNGGVSERYPPNRVVKYKHQREGQSLLVVPVLDYLQSIGSVPLEGIHYYWNPFHCQYPNLDITVVNNRAESLALTEAVFEVRSSVSDFSPVIVFKDNNFLRQLEIRNEGWGKITNPVVECNLLPTGSEQLIPDPSIEHIPVSAPFSFRFELEDFAEFATVDLTEALQSLGVRVAEIEAAGYRSQQLYVFNAMQRGLDTTLAQHIGRFPNLETIESWAPFPDGYVAVAGRLSFDGVDRESNPKHFTIPFKVRVFLFNVRYDLPRPPSYQYQIELEPEGTDYKVACPVSHSLAAGEVDRFQIRVSCARSAVHDLVIRWRFAGGHEIASPQIRLVHFVPRTFASEQTEGSKVGECWPEVQDTESEYPGCIQASFLQALQNLADSESLNHEEE